MTGRDAQQQRDTVHFCEHHAIDQKTVDEVSRVTWVGVWVNITLAIVKTIGGVAAGSRALIADAVHTVSDLATDIAILVGVRYWSAPADADHPHGHRKIETLITLGIGIALALVGLSLGYEAVRWLAHAVTGGEVAATVQHIDTGAGAWLALGAAALSIVSKELLYRWTVRKGVRLGSSALVANAWHHRSDAISSIPPLLTIGGLELGASFGYDLWFLDPVGTVVVCVMLIQAAWEIIRETLAALLDASADRRLCSDIRKTVLSTPGVISTHAIRTRVICSSAVAVDLNITVDKDLSVEKGHAIATDVRHRILSLEAGDSTRVVDVHVHVDPGDPADMRLPGSGGGDTMMDWQHRGL